MKAERIKAVDALKAGGALLIINSHLEAFYPWPWLSFDGMMGNTIFFFTTGFTLAGSLERRKEESLASFLWKRLLRMLPAMWMILLVLPPREIDWSSPAAVVHEFIYPPPFPFFQVILPCYLIFFWLARQCRWQMLAGLSAMMLCLVIVAEYLEMRSASESGVLSAWSQLGDWTWGCFFAVAMLLGAAFQRGRILCLYRRPGPLSLILLAVLSAYLLLRAAAAGKLLPDQSLASRPLLIATLPACLLVVAVTLLMLSMPAPKRLLDRWPVASVVAFLSLHTWETYVLHMGVARWPWVAQAPFPLGILLVFSLTLALAPVLRIAISSAGKLARLIT